MGQAGNWALFISDTERAPAGLVKINLKDQMAVEVSQLEVSGGALCINNERRPNSRLPPSQLALAWIPFFCWSRFLQEGLQQFSEKTLAGDQL